MKCKYVQEKTDKHFCDAMLEGHKYLLNHIMPLNLPPDPRNRFPSLTWGCLSCRCRSGQIRLSEENTTLCPACWNFLSSSLGPDAKITSKLCEKGFENRNAECETSDRVRGNERVAFYEHPAGFTWRAKLPVVVFTGIK